MQPFLQRLKALLQQLPLPTVHRWPVDMAVMRKAVLSGLEHLHESEAPFEQQQQEWSQPGRLEFFVAHLAQALTGRFDVRSAKGQAQLLEAGVRRKVLALARAPLPEGLMRMSAPQKAELDRLAERAWEATTVQPHAQRIGLLRLDAESEKQSWVLTQAGRIFLDLTGREAVSWVLLLETVYGGGVPELLSASLATALLPAANGSPSIIPIAALFAGHEDVLVRLQALALLRGEVIDILRDQTIVSAPVDFRDQVRRNPSYYFRFYLTPIGKALLGAIAADEDSPMKLLALALHRDQTAQALTGYLSKNGPATARSTDELIRQARMIAHELNNVLPPIRPAIEDLFLAIQDRDRDAEQLRKYRTRIEGGVDRALRFVNELRDTVQLARTTALEAVDVAACLREALASLNGAASAVTLAPPPVLPPLRGQRHDLVKALAELLRNALRATKNQPTPRIQVEAQLRGAYIQIAVDDNGPGIPADQREAVFVEGFTSRDGGGQGLALVREALRAFGGSVACEDGPLHGARFLVLLPLNPQPAAGEAVT